MQACVKRYMVKEDESKVFVEIDFYLFVCYVYNYLTLIDLYNVCIFVIKEKQKKPRKAGKIHVIVNMSICQC